MEAEKAASEAEAVRKFRAKRINEQVKLAASLINTLAAAVIATAIIIPAIRAETVQNALDGPVGC